IITRLTRIPPLSLHDALPIYGADDRQHDVDLFEDLTGRQRERFRRIRRRRRRIARTSIVRSILRTLREDDEASGRDVRELESTRSEEHTSELQSRVDLVCRLL